MDKSEEYADKALERFLAAEQSLVGKLMTFREGITHLAEFVHGEVKRAYQAGQADLNRKESNDEL